MTNKMYYIKISYKWVTLEVYFSYETSCQRGKEEKVRINPEQKIIFKIKMIRMKH